MGILQFGAGVVCGTAMLWAAAPVYVIATAAGVVPGTSSIAVRQHLINPVVVAYDPSGTLYYGTYQQVWRLNPDGTTTLIAGTGLSNLAQLGDGGPATSANLSWIDGLAVDAQDNVYISDFGALEVRKVTPEGTIARFAGTGALPGYLVPSNAGTGVPALKVPLNPGGMAIDSTYLYVADTETSSVLAFTFDGTNSKVIAGNHGNQSQGDGGLATSASLYYPGAIAVANGMLYINEAGGARIREVNLRNGIISQLVQLIQSYLSDNGNDGLAADTDGSVYLQHDNTVQRIYGNTLIPQPYAGGGDSSPGDPGAALQVTLLLPKALAINPVTHDLALADFSANLIEVVTQSTGAIQTIAGSEHFAGDSGPAALAVFSGLESVAADSQGNLYLADVGNNRIRMIDTSGIVTTVAGTGMIGFSGDGGPATSAKLNLKHAIKFSSILAVDSSGNLYISDYGNGRIRKVDTTGIITTVAGGGASSITNGMNAKSAALQPGPLAMDSNGNLYFGNAAVAVTGTIAMVYKINPAGVLTAFAGVAGSSKGADSGPALNTPIGYVYSLATDSLNNLYICDWLNNRVLTVTPSGIMSPVAGNGSVPSGPVQSGAPLATAIGPPTAVAIDSSGDVFICTAGQVMEVDSTGTLNPIAGVNTTPMVSGGDGGSSTQASFTSLAGAALDPSGNVYLSDGGVYLREAMPVGAGGAPPVISAGGVIGAGGSNPPVQWVSPGAMVSIFGSNFSPTGTQRLVAATDINSGMLPTTLAGLCVSFGGVNASIAGVFPNQLNVLVPTLPATGPATGAVTVQVTTNCSASHAVSGNRSAVAVDVASPEFFVNSGAIAAIGVNGPIVAGGTVEVYGTGWGATSPAVAPGMVPGSAAQLATPPSLTLGGEAIPAADILYAGISPCCAGVYQVDFVIPDDVPAGNLPLVITAGGISSPANAYLTVGTR